MKNLMIAICVFVVMLIGVIVADVIMEENMRNMISQCDTLISNVDSGDWEDIIPIYDDIRTKWDNFRSVLFLLLNHADIDNVDFAMIELNSMIEARELAHVKNYAENLRFYMDELLDTETVSIENIL